MRCRAGDAAMRSTTRSAPHRADSARCGRVAGVVWGSAVLSSLSLVLAPRMYRSTNNRRSNVAEPDVYFRILHVTLEDTNASAAYREQTVEVSLGPKGAFENGNIGTLTRLVPADRLVSAVPPCRGKPKPPKAPRTPRVVELLRKAIEWQALLESGAASNQAAIARREGITRARVTQVMGLLRLTPEIQEHVLSLPDMVRRPAITERALRPIAQLGNVTDQKAKFEELIEQVV